MDRALVHFELFVRHGRAPWRLALETGDRRDAFEAVDAAIDHAPGAEVRLLKETRDPRSGDFRPLVLREHGVRPERRPGRDRARRTEISRSVAMPPTCNRPQDLHAGPARATIGQVLDGWLRRHRATPFELLHRADLAERLEACEAELSAAVYNAALAEAAARGAALEPVRRHLDGLVRATIERVVGDDPDLGFRLGVAVAARLRACSDWAAKLEAVLDLIEGAPDAGRPAAIAARVLQQPLIDILGASGDLDAILGARPPGDQLLMLMQIASAPTIAAVMADDAALARRVPRLSGLSARLALVLHGRASFARARRAIGKRVLAVLAGEARLWPADPEREVEGVQTLARLIAVAGRTVDQEAASAALADRWRRLAGSAFLDARLALCGGAMEETDVLLGLIDAASGRAAVEALSQRLLLVLAGHEFDREARFSPDPPSIARGRLASLAIRVRASALRPEARAEAERRLQRLAARMRMDAEVLSA